MEVLLGLHEMYEREDVQKRSISNVVIHEDFTSTSVRDENDIAIATLSEPVEFRDTISTICLPKPGMMTLLFV